MSEQGTSMAQGEPEIGEDSSQFLTPDLFSDIFGRVDGVTLARLSSVSTQFRSAALEGSHWENLCNKRWPSTTQPSVKALISSAGGFIKFYRNSFPFATPRHHQNECDHESSASADDFVSLVDVVYNGVPVVTRLIDGINGAEALCGPLVDVVDTTSEGDLGVRMNLEDDEQVLSIDRKNFPVASGNDRHRLRRALRNQMRVSWILIHKKTQRMVNLASWEALSAMRHCGYGDDDVILCFGSVLPSATSAPVLCNIIMRCKMAEGAESVTVVKVTELGFTLEHGDGVRLLRRQEAVEVLSCAMSCAKTIDHSKVARTYCKVIAAQTTNREALIRRENRRQSIVAICFVGAIVIFLTSFCFKPRC